MTRKSFWTPTGGGTDSDAIHDNVAGEIDALTEATPVTGDWVLIEDASDSNNKKKANASNFLSGGGSGNAVTAGTALTDDTASALNTFEDWGTEVITITDPGAAVTVIANLSGYMQHTPSARRLVRVKVDISFDGGSTWDEGTDVRCELDSTDMDNNAFSVNHFKTGTPTGDIKIKAQLQQTALGSAGDVDFIGGTLIASMA